MSTHRVVALVGDLMDRSRLSAAVPDIELSSDPAEIAGADVVVVDLHRYAAALADIRRRVPGAFLVAYGPHVDDATLTTARAAGADPCSRGPGSSGIRRRTVPRRAASRPVGRRRDVSSIDP